MAMMLNLKINVKDIDKSRLFVGEKGTYLQLTVAVNDELNNFDQDVSAWQEQNEQERAQKAPKKYLGNGKVFWRGNNQQPQQQQGFQNSQPPQQGFGGQPQQHPQQQQGDEDLPF